jgi:hypothetical protein
MNCLLLALATALALTAPAFAAEPAPTITTHSYAIGGTTLSAKAEIGRIAIRDEKTGAVRGYMAFTV